MGGREGGMGGREGGRDRWEGGMGGWVDGWREEGREGEGGRGKKGRRGEMLSTAGNVLPPKKPHLKTYYVLQKSSSCYYCAHG